MTLAFRPVIALALLACIACRRSEPEPKAVTTSAPAAATSARDRNPWDEARSRGIDFRALGQEPGWYLEIDNERWMRLFFAYAERTATTPVPEPVRPGQPATLESTADGHRLRVEIAAASCEDAMSGEPYPATVSVTIDGTLLKGCGRWLGN